MPTFRGIRTANHPSKVKLNQEIEQRKRKLLLRRISSPEIVTLDMRLVLDMPDGKVKRSTPQRSSFTLDNATMLYRNDEAFVWKCSVMCNVSRVEFSHPWVGAGEVLLVTDLAAVKHLSSGDIVRFEVADVMLSQDHVMDFQFPSEDHIIEEDPDPIDWQKMLIATTAMKPRRKRGTS